MKYFLVILLIFQYGCKKTNDVAPPPASSDYYYPPLTGDEWQTKSAASLGWNETKLQEAFDYAATRNAYGLIILHKGKIVKEQYWNGWTKGTRYYIASAGKSVVAFLTGVAQEQGMLNVEDKTSRFLGAGWTALPLAKENLITIKQQLSMTTGLDDAVADPDCTLPACLTYKADAGTRWSYHNAPYHLLQTVLANASGVPFNQYSKQKLFDKVGMPNAFWFNHVMYCTTREAARFGLLTLSKGKWDGAPILNDPAYFTAMTNTSQLLNQSYGYLWWLNGKPSAMVPGSQLVFPTALVPAAPADMYMALGKDDKKIYVVPGLDLVVVRLGDDAGGSVTGPSSFDNDLWTKLKAAINY